MLSNPKASNPLPDGQFKVIYADPPWQYEMYSDAGYAKSPDAHYSCMPFRDLAAMRDDLLFRTAPDAVCFMWAVWPKLDEAFKLMEAWGFKYKTGGAWHKKTIHGKSAFGTGYIMRSASEPFLIGSNGKPSILNRSTRNIIEAATRGHSRKPDETYALIEGLFPGPYLELFARNTRPGWQSWGNEVGKFESES